MLVEIGADVVGPELPQAERALGRALARQQAVVEINEDIACVQPESVASGNLDRPVDCDPLGVEIVASLFGCDQHWALRLGKLRKDAIDIDQWSVRAALDGAIREHHELLSLVVGA